MKQPASDVERNRHPLENANIVPPNAPVLASIRWPKEFAALQELRARYSPGDTRYSDEFLFWLDAPDHWPMSGQYQRLAGWCVGSDGQPPAQVRCKVGNRIFCTACVYDRPDVAPWPVTSFRGDDNDAMCLLFGLADGKYRKQLLVSKRAGKARLWRQSMSGQETRCAFCGEPLELRLIGVVAWRVGETFVCNEFCEDGILAEKVAKMSAGIRPS